MTLTTLAEAERLAPGSSAQKADRIVLNRALELGQEKGLPIHTDSKYTCSVICAPGEIGKESGSLNAGKKGIGYGKEIHRLLEAGQSHHRWQWGSDCKGHQKGNSEVIQGGCLADAGMERPARPGETLQRPLPPSLPLYQST